MENREIVVYKEATVNKIVQLIMAIAVVLAFVLGMNISNIPKEQVKNVIGTAVNETRDLVATEIMSESTKKAIGMLLTGVDNDKKEIETLKEQLVVVQTQNAQMHAALESALIPESTVKAAAVNHVVEPVKDGFITVKVKASDLWNNYEFQPEKVKGWISNVF